METVARGPGTGVRCIALLVVLLLAVTTLDARAQLVGANWGASSAGHLAFVTQGNGGGRSTLRIVSPDDG